MIDSDGFRPNVAIVIANDDGRVLWARRRGRSGWQFPQGGIQEGESPEDALYRELAEEVGLTSDDVAVLARTRGWLRYRLPRHVIRRQRRPVCVGQKQIWFLLRLVSSEDRIRLDRQSKPEFDRWVWLDPGDAARRVVFFKRRVYERALAQLGPVLYSKADSAAQLDRDSAGDEG